MSPVLEVPDDALDPAWLYRVRAEQPATAFA